MNGQVWDAVREAVRSATGDDPGRLAVRAVGGGCIHHAHVATGGARRFFVKANRADRAPLFAAERRALEALGGAGAITVPGVIAHGESGDTAFLVLEFLELRPIAGTAAARLGEQLAALHRHRSPDGSFGWPADNFIGSTPQPNGWSASWADFFRDRRLGFQFSLAEARGAGFRRAGELLEAVPAILDGHDPAPSLLHGDLWTGNAAAGPGGEPVVYDPASYFGDRETDLAFTELFGGFGPPFREAYHSSHPVPPGSGRRRTLYNLYHVLNHDHLFGGGYHAQAAAMIDRLLDP